MEKVRPFRTPVNTKNDSRKKEMIKAMEIMTNLMQYGFSIALAAYLLVKMDSRLAELTKAVVKLGVIIEKGFGVKKPA